MPRFEVTGRTRAQQLLGLADGPWHNEKLKLNRYHDRLESRLEFTNVNK